MLRDDIDVFYNSIDSNITVVCATKYVDVLDMQELLKHNINNFGENRVDSFLRKYESLKDENIIWHFIGHLQRNKATDVINKIDYLHSLDSLELAKIINNNRLTPLNCFIEVSINNEESKNGVSLDSIDSFILELAKYKNINIVGLMMMTSLNSNNDEKYLQFLKLKELKDTLNNKYNLNLKYLSMGMSDDYKEAIKASATHIRLGRILWKN